MFMSKIKIWNIKKEDKIKMQYCFFLLQFLNIFQDSITYNVVVNMTIKCMYKGKAMHTYFHVYIKFYQYEKYFTNLEWIPLAVLIILNHTT